MRKSRYSCYNGRMRTSSLEILEQSQLSSPQAKAILQVMELEFTAQYEGLATKADVGLLKADVGLLRSDVRSDIALLHSDIALVKSEMATKADISRLELKIESGRVETGRWIIIAVSTAVGMLLGAFYFLLNYARK